MRILIWSEAFWPTIGGVEFIVDRLVRDLKASGDDVLVMTASRPQGRPEKDERFGVPVLRLPLFEVLRERRPEALLRLKRDVRSAIASFQPDVLHVNLLGPGSALLLDETPARTAVVVSLHLTVGNLRSAGPETLFGRTLDRARWVTACSRPALDRVLALAPQLAARSSVLRYGIDLPEAEPPDLSFWPPRLVAGGRLVRMKGFDVAIDSLAQVRVHVPDARLTIVGDGPERSALESRAEAAGVADAVEFVGAMPHDAFIALLGRATMVLMPSREIGVEYTEGVGIVALDAAAAGRPVIASNVGGVIETVLDGETGLLVPPDDGGALARAILQLLANPDAARAMGRAARARIRAHFGWDECFRAFRALFLRLRQEP